MSNTESGCAYEIEPELRGPTPRRLRNANGSAVFVRWALNIGLAIFCIAYFCASVDIAGHNDRIQRTERVLAAEAANSTGHSPVDACAISQMRADRADAVGYWTTGIILGSILYVGMVVMVVSYQHSRDRWLRHGVAVPAEVVDKKATSDGEGGTWYSMTYAYHTTAGRHEWLTRGVGKSAYEKYALHDIFTVLYDPDQPDSSRPYFTFSRTRLEGYVNG